MAGYCKAKPPVSRPWFYSDAPHMYDVGIFYAQIRAERADNVADI